MSGSFMNQMVFLVCIVGKKIQIIFFNHHARNIFLLGDVAGHLNNIAKALRPLSLVDLKTVEAKLEAQIATLPVAQIKVIRTLFYDVVAMIGTNPAVMLVKERLLDATKYVKFEIAMKIVFSKILI